WFILGLMYSSYYMCRYNFRFATPGMVEEFHFNTFQITSILSAWSVAYGFGQLLNGLLTDRIRTGGRVRDAAGHVQATAAGGFAGRAGLKPLARSFPPQFVTINSLTGGRGSVLLRETE